MQYRFEKINYDDFKETTIEEFPGKTVFTTEDWYKYLQLDSNVVPVIIKIYADDTHIGYFYAGEIKKFGIRIIASPFSGWSTCWMGFEVKEDINKFDLVEPLWKYLTKELHYFYAEIIDRDFSLEEAQKRGFVCEGYPTLDLRIDREDEELLKSFKDACKRLIKQFDRRGATIEIAEPDDVFAEEYYDQLIDVFAKQELTPSYSVDKVKNIMKIFAKTNKMLCLRVRDPEGKSIASSIYFGFNKKCYFWGGASYRDYQHYRPNEYMFWTAMKYWREKGCEVMDLVGDREYKRKFCPTPVTYALIYLTKYPILIKMRNLAKKIYWWLLEIKKKFRKGE